MQWVFIGQRAADELGGDLLSGAGEEALGEVLGERDAMGVAWGWVEEIWQEVDMQNAKEHRIFRVEF